MLFMMFFLLMIGGITISIGVLKYKNYEVVNLYEVLHKKFDNIQEFYGYSEELEEYINKSVTKSRFLKFNLLSFALNLSIIALYFADSLSIMYLIAMYVVAFDLMFITNFILQRKGTLNFKKALVEFYTRTYIVAFIRLTSMIALSIQSILLFYIFGQLNSELFQTVSLLFTLYTGLYLAVLVSLRPSEFVNWELNNKLNNNESNNEEESSSDVEDTSEEEPMEEVPVNSVNELSDFISSKLKEKEQTYIYTNSRLSTLHKIKLNNGDTKLYTTLELGIIQFLSSKNDLLQTIDYDEHIIPIITELNYIEQTRKLSNKLDKVLENSPLISLIEVDKNDFAFSLELFKYEKLVRVMRNSFRTILENVLELSDDDLKEFISNDLYKDKVENISTISAVTPYNKLSLDDSIRTAFNVKLSKLDYGKFVYINNQLKEFTIELTYLTNQIPHTIKKGNRNNIELKLMLYTKNIELLKKLMIDNGIQENPILIEKLERAENLLKLNNELIQVI